MEGFYETKEFLKKIILNMFGLTINTIFLAPRIEMHCKRLVITLVTFDIAIGTGI